MTQRVRVLVLFGTRPEAVKMAPVIQELQRSEWAEPFVVTTGQHREMVDQVLKVFGLSPNVDLELMQAGQSLTDLGGRALIAIGALLRDVRPDILLVQGDTTSALAGALAAFYSQIPVAHIEAGLRSHNPRDPFPEEANRRLISVLADLHFAPTDVSKQNLLAESIEPDRIIVTGNTVVDALQSITASSTFHGLPKTAGSQPGELLILATLHRRESWGDPMTRTCRALRRVLDTFPNTRIVFPMHRNPIVRQAVTAELGGHQRAFLIEPLDYLDFVKAMSDSYLIVTDSGGVQEEAPVLGKPVLVVRDTTERPEAISAGTALLVGTDENALYNSVAALLTDGTTYRRMARAVSPFGDGTAARQIVNKIRSWANRENSSPLELVAR